MTATSVRFWARVNRDGPTVRDDLGPCWLWDSVNAYERRDGRGWNCRQCRREARARA